jgi:hypothetical protein
VGTMAAKAATPFAALRCAERRALIRIDNRSAEALRHPKSEIVFAEEWCPPLD